MPRIGSHSATDYQLACLGDCPESGFQTAKRLGREAFQQMFSLHLLTPHGYALDEIISNIFRGHPNFVTFANFCSNSFVSFNALLCALL
jgi:hypothetical protein